MTSRVGLTEEKAQFNLAKAAEKVQTLKAQKASQEEVRAAVVAHAEANVKLIKARHAPQEEVKVAVLAYRNLRDAPLVTIPKQESLRKFVIRLSTIPDRWLLVDGLLANPTGLSKEALGPIYALHATLSLLKDMYYLDDPAWREVRDRVCIGLVKDTKYHGNTSVSMGAARVVPQFESNVGFLNCGTGGIKYQMYSKTGGCLHLEAEYKPKGGASPNALKIGLYTPQEPVTFERTRQLLLDELMNEQIPWKECATIPKYAFITGTIRQAWEEASDSDKAILECDIQRLFEGTGIKPLGAASFFLPQEEEGKLELLGTQAMYNNLVQVACLDEGTNVVASFGIGRGSCQWMVQQASGDLDLIPHRAGMSKLDELSKVGRTVVEAYRTPTRLAGLVTALDICLRPVIALKSGCTLLLEMKEYAYLKDQLVTPVKPVGERIRIYIAKNNDKAFPIEFIWAQGTLDRLCAETGLVLGESLTSIYRDQDGSLVTSPSSIQPEDLLVFAPRSETFVPRTHFKPQVDSDALRLQDWAKVGQAGPSPTSENPGLVVCGGLGWAEQSANVEAAGQYTQIASQIAALGGDSVYVYPLYALHTTVVTLSSFKSSSPLRVASPSDLDIIKRAWKKALLQTFEQSIKGGPVILSADKIILSPGAGFILFSDPLNRFAEFRAKVKEALVLVLKDPSIIPLRLEVKNGLRDAVHVPNIIHSTICRFTRDSLDGRTNSTAQGYQSGAWDQFEAKFQRLVQTWEPMPVVIDHLSLVDELVPFMHSKETFDDGPGQHRFWLRSQASTGNKRIDAVDSRIQPRISTRPSLVFGFLGIAALAVGVGLFLKFIKPRKST